MYLFSKVCLQKKRLMQPNTKKENDAKKKSTPLFLMHFFVGHTNFVVVCVEIKEFVFPVMFLFFSSPAVQISQEKKHVSILFFN